MRKNYRHVLAAFYGVPWAITAVKLAEIETVLIRRASGDMSGAAEFVHMHKKNPLAFDDHDETPARSQSLETGQGYQLVGNTGVISVNGTITPRPTMFEEWSGGVSHDAIGRATDAALKDDKVSTIVYDIDSPGGTVYGMPETAAKVAAAGKIKPTIAVANHVAASAAYWYASQCGEIVVTPGGTVGCIGVLMRTVDATKALEMMGIKDDLISNDSSPFKSEGWPQTPVTPEAIASLRKQCNDYAAMFVDAIAKGRGIRPATVERDFGQGRMLLANDALAARMVDRIATLDEVISGLAKKGRSSKRANATAARLGLPIRTNSGNPKNPLDA